ncbi:hypothetical protein [Sphingomonas rosea]
MTNFRERRRQARLASTRSCLSQRDFIDQCELAGVDGAVAAFVWRKMQPYYFKPLTPSPGDRPVGEFRIDGGDLSDMVSDFEKAFGRRWKGQWVGSDDPTLLEFMQGLVASTEAE